MKRCSIGCPSYITWAQVVQWDVGFSSIQVWSPHGGQCLNLLSEVGLATDDEL